MLTKTNELNVLKIYKNPYTLKKKKKYIDDFLNRERILKTHHPELYKDMLIKVIQTDEILTNKHHDFANFRMYLEWLILKFYYPNSDGKLHKITVDTGSSLRTYLSCIFEIALRPILSNADIDRITKYKYNFYTLLVPLTLEEFMKRMEKNLRHFFFNFTDVLYYIDDETLLKLNSHMDYGIYGTFTMHILQQRDLKLIFSDEIGYVKQIHNDEIFMQVLGNNSIYTHKTRFIDLLENERVYIGNGENTLQLSRFKKIEFGPDDNRGVFICGTIAKVRNQFESIVPEIKFDTDINERIKLAKEANVDYEKIENMAITTLSRNYDADEVMIFNNLLATNKNFNIKQTDITYDIIQHTRYQYYDIMNKYGLNGTKQLQSSDTENP